MSPPAVPLVVTVLPPLEGFGPGRAGAVGTLVRLLSKTPGFRSLIVGGRQPGPVFADVAFHSVKPANWWLGNVNIRYGAAMLGRLRRSQPALIEVHNRPELALFLAWRMPRVPVVLFLHNDPHGMRQAGTAAERAVLLAKLARVVTVSDYLRQRFLADVVAPRRPPVVLPNCIDLAALPPRQEKQTVILFAGRIVREKGPDAFVAACAGALPHLPGWRAEMIGADRFRADSPETDFVRQVRAAAERGGVQVLGYREHDFVLRAMARAAIMVMPSRWEEPFGLVALEALASGAALICSPRGGLREVAGDAAVYADPDDPPALATAIRALADDPERRSALAEAGRARAELFDAVAIAERLAMLRHGTMTSRELRC